MSHILSTLAVRPIFWVAVVLAIRVVAVNLVWMVRTAPRGAVPLTLVRIVHGIGEQPNVVTGLYLTYLVLPFLLAAALRVGDVRFLGLRAPGSMESASVALGASLATAAAIVAAQRAFIRWGGSVGSGHFAPYDARAWGDLGLMAVALEAHWAFFRAGPLAIGLKNVSASVFLGLGLLALEAWSSPDRRVQFLDPSAVMALSRGAALAVLSASVFLLTGSSAWCLVCHAVAIGALAAMRLVPAPRLFTASPAADAGSIEPTVV